MRKVIIPIICLAALGGCSDQDSGAAKSRQEFDSALAAFASAQQGYVPATGKTGTSTPNLDAYRQQQLQQAIKELKGVEDKGSATQRAGARLLISDAQAAIAQRQAQDAMNRWAPLMQRSSQAINLLVAVSSAAARAQEFRVDYSTMLDRLHADQQDADHAAAEFEQQAKVLQAKADATRQEMEAAQSKAAAETTRAMGLQSQAFVAAGAAQKDLYTRAAQAHGEATRSSASAQKLGEELQVCEGQLAVVDAQVKLRHSASQSIGDQVTNLEALQKKNQDGKDAAINDMNSKAEDLRKRLDALVQDFAKDVDTPFKDAEKMSQDAIATLSDAVSKASTTADKKALQLALLGRQVSNASIVSQHVFVTSGFRRTLDLLASQSGRLMPGVSSFGDDAANAKKAQDDLTATAQSAIDKARALATELGSEEYVTTATAQLADYSQSINEAVGITSPNANPTSAPSDSQ